MPNDRFELDPPDRPVSNAELRESLRAMVVRGLQHWRRCSCPACIDRALDDLRAGDFDASCIRPCAGRAANS